jgi:Matrixin
VSGGVSSSKQLLAAVIVGGLGCAWLVPAHAEETSQPNWTSADAPCAKYNDLRKRILGNIGVKIDATEPWADGFRRALGFWNEVLAVNFHEETNLDSCAVRIIDAPPEILNNAMVARSQLAERDNFRGEIAVRPGAAKVMSSAEMYGVAVHELGHMLGLKHNASSQSIMYFLNVNGSEVLDRHDILDLSSHHELRVAPVPTGFYRPKLSLLLCRYR